MAWEVAGTPEGPVQIQEGTVQDTINKKVGELTEALVTLAREVDWYRAGCMKLLVMSKEQFKELSPLTSKMAYAELCDFIFETERLMLLGPEHPEVLRYLGGPEAVQRFIDSGTLSESLRKG